MNFQEQIRYREEMSDRLRPRVKKAIQTLTMREGSKDQSIGERLFINKAVAIAPRFQFAWVHSAKVDRHVVGRSLGHFLRGTYSRKNHKRTYSSMPAILDVWEATCFDVEQEAQGKKPTQRELIVREGQLPLVPLSDQLEEAIQGTDWDAVAGVREELLLREL